MAMVSLMAMSVHRTRRRPSRGPRGGATPGACRTPDRRRTTRRRGAPTSSPAGRRTNVGSVASFDRSRRHRATSRAPLTAPASWRQAFRQHGPTSASKRFRATDGPHQQSEPGRARPLDAGPAPGHQVRRLQAARFASRGSWACQFVPDRARNRAHQRSPTVKGPNEPRSRSRCPRPSPSQADNAGRGGSRRAGGVRPRGCTLGTPAAHAAGR
jgi:hypothetical protein